jgi:hypothetical protein
VVNQFGEPEGRFSLLSGKHMCVLLLSETFRDVAQTTRDHVGWFTRLQPQGCLSVSEVVKADTSESYLFDDSIEPLGHDIGVKWRTVGACEYEIGLGPSWTRFELFGDLILPMSWLTRISSS